MKNVCIDGNMELFKELLNIYNYKKPYNYIYLLECVSEPNTKKNIYDWVLNSSCFQTKEVHVIEIVSNYIFSMDKLNAYELLYRILKKQNTNPNIMGILFSNACKYNHFAIAKNIFLDFKDTHNKKNNKLHQIVCNNCANICENIVIYKDLLFCEWLFETIPELNSNKQAIYNGFKYSVLHLEIEIAKLFHQLLGDDAFENFVKINNYAEYNYLFEVVCCFNNIEFAHWLHSLKIENWFLHQINYIKLFKLICTNTHASYNIYNKKTTRRMIETCNWLIQLDPNIVLSIQDDIFNIYTRKLQYYKRLNEEKESIIMVLDWFVSLNPYFYFFDTYENTYKMRSPKDAKWEERKIYHYLLLHPETETSNTSIATPQNQIANAVSILQHLPYQVSSYIISFI